MEQIRDKLKRAKRVAVLTGAGASAESGIPVFRGNGGLWRQFRAQDLATPEAFANNPKLVWEWYDWRRKLIAEARPNPGHFALAKLEEQVPQFTLITQNVDDLHERAGSRNILHVHGSIWTTRCPQCDRETQDLRVPLPELPPSCPCGGTLRPGVVWFGEHLPPGVWAAAEDSARQAEVFLVIGTSAAVYPAAGLARLAKLSGASVVEVNIDRTDLSPAMDSFLQGPSGDILPQLIA